jgi:hypothetical protein
MNLRNKAVEAAYESRKYVDAAGVEWRRGMDGWFLDDVDGKGGVMLIRHHDMVARIEREHPDE